MKLSLIKLGLLAVLVLLPTIKNSGAYFNDQERVDQINFSAGYWEVPTLVYPLDDTIATASSAWVLNPYMDWTYSLDGFGVSYVYESSHLSTLKPDGSFLVPIYVSGYLSNSLIPALGTPDGIYYWHVRAKVADNWSPWSDVWKLTVDRTTPIPEVTPEPTPSSAVVINEVYYRGGNEEEFIELYNNSENPVTLTGWTITDNNQTDNIPTLTIIGHGFAVLVTNSSSVVLHSAALPDTPKVSVGGNIGNQLNNDGDRLILKNNTSEIIDQISWGNNVSVFNPAILGVAVGHSLARSPKGHDTDQVSDFIDNASPDAGTNPHPYTTMVTNVDFYLQNNNHEVGFKVYGSGLVEFESIDYVVKYNSDNGEQALRGSKIINGASEVVENNLILGTCTTGGTCTYQSGVTKITLEIKLKGIIERTLTKEINL